MLLNSMADAVVYVPRAERVSFDMLVRYRLAAMRATVWLKNLTCGGARIEGMALATGDVLALYLPSLKPKNARVAWTVGTSAGLEFERPLHPDIFESLVLRHARPRERTETDRLLALDGGPALPAAALVPA